VNRSHASVAGESAAIKRFLWFFLRQYPGGHDVAGALATRQLTTGFGHMPQTAGSIY
jgi:hypothetical protein